MINTVIGDEEFISLLNAFSQPAAILSADYKIVATNQAYKEHHKVTESIIGQYCYRVSHGYQRPCDQEGESCPLKQCQSSGLRQRVLHLHNTCHGQEHVDVELLPLPQGTKNPQFYLEIMHMVKVATAQPEGEGLVGRSAIFNQMLSLIQRAAPSEISVLLQGESGTGKELVAKALHTASRRSQSPFVTVECSGLSETLFESEMFGHEKGAFTGAINKKEGLVAAARGGTLFLDEVGDIPLSLQVKLLRLIETGSYRSVGGVELQHADFRLICASHHDLKKQVEQGVFRQDLYYRISSFPIKLPSLKERSSDLPMLTEVLLKRIQGGEGVTVSDEAMSILRRYSFPGNIRELRNILERAVLLADQECILPEHLPEELLHSQPLPAENNLLNADLIPLSKLEGAYLQKVKEHFQGNNRELAERLGVSERTLYRKLQLL